MAITSLELYKSAQKQKLGYAKASATSVAGGTYDIIASAGVPVAGVLAGTDTASGVMPNNTTAGFLKYNFPMVAPKLTNFELCGSSSGMSLTAVLYDVLWKAGAYAFNANVTLSTQPDISVRLPNADYYGTELWFEAATAFTGIPTYTVTYTNQDGVTGRTTTASGASGQPIGQMRRVSLQEGDTGIQKVESVVGSVATAGTVNFLIARPVAFDVIVSSVAKRTQSIIENPPIEIYPTSALMPFFHCNSTATGSMVLNIEVADG